MARDYSATPAPPGWRSAPVFHAELLHLAGQGIATPAEELGGVLLQAIGLAQRHADEDALHLRHRLVEQPMRAGFERLLGPVRQARHPVVRDAVLRTGPAEIGGD